MNLKKYIVFRYAVCAIATMTGISAQAQDLLADRAPIDHKLHTIDSISLQRIIDIEDEEMPAFSLYNDEWSHEFVHSYNQPKLEGDYKIDLRHFAMPTPSRKITSKYGYRRSFRRMHKGLDIKVYTGDTIVSAFAGKVRIVKDQGRRVGYGKYVVIRHPNGLETIYAHLSKHLVVEDQIVKAGEPIGLGGNTGRSYGSHLHFETRLLGDDIDPSFMFDFENQDVRGDYYIYQGHNRGYCTDASTGEGRVDVAVRGEKEVWKQTPEEAAANAQAVAKAKESRTFQQQRVAEQRASRIHKVRNGETLGLIAKKNHTTVAKLCKLNGLKATTILRVGQLIKVN